MKELSYTLYLESRLRSFLLKDDDQHLFAPVPPPRCHIAFQRPVVFYPKFSTNLFGKEQLTCPLPGCNSQFDNLELWLKHLSNCPWLSNSWDRCSLSQLPERCTARAPRSGRLRKFSSRKPSILKRAVSFFKNFGRKRAAGTDTSVLRPRPSSCLSMYVLESHRLYYSSNPNGQHSPYDHPQSQEMETGVPELQKNGSFYEMKTRTSQHSVNATNLDLGTPESNNCYEMATDELVEVNVTTSNPGTSEPDDDPKGDGSAQQLVTPNAEIPENSRHGTVHLDLLTNDGRLGVSPVSQLNHPIYALPDFSAPCGSMFPYPEENTEPSMNNQTALMSDSSDLCPPASRFSRSPGSQMFGPSETLVRQLGILIRCLNDDWSNRLSLYATSPLIKAKIHQPSMSETGLHILQKLYRGAPPSTFEDIFALIHVAFACAYLYNDNEKQPMWEEAMCQDAFQFYHAIVTPQDRCLFLKVAYAIWSSPGCSAINTNHSEGFFLNDSEAQTFPPGSPILWEILRKGAVISACIAFLDCKLILALSEYFAKCIQPLSMLGSMKEISIGPRSPHRYTLFTIWKS